MSSRIRTRMIIRKALSWLRISFLNFCDPSYTDIIEMNRQIGCVPDETDMRIAESYEQLHRERWAAFHAEFDS
jgi:hypothetical protein